MDFQTIKTYFNRCNAYESLFPDDDKNLDIDNFGPVLVRGRKLVQVLGNTIERSDRPVFQLFTGLPGSGKSTELKRLVKRLQDPARAHLLTVMVDGDASLDLTNEIDIPDILSAILLAVETEVLKIEGRDPQNALEEGYFTRLWHWLKTTEPELTKAEYGIPSGPKLVVEMKSRPSLRQRVRATLATHLSTFLEQVRNELVALEARALAKGYRGLVVIFDSLEKLRGTSDNWHQVLSSAERIFSGGAPYLRLPVHVIYTLPTALVARTRFDGLAFIPMIKLHERSGAPCPEGYAAARELIRHRVPDDVLQQLLGHQCEDRVKEMIRWSGGYPRELVRLLRSALAMEDMPLSEDDFQRLFSDIKSSYRLVVPAEAFDWLALVRQQHYFTIDNDAHRPIADQMLQNNVVLRYANGEDWFDLHPAVAEIPGVVAALARLNAPPEPPVAATPAHGA